MNYIIIFSMLIFLLVNFVAIFALQIVFFAYAALRKTDKVTDLAYGLTFVIVVTINTIYRGNFDIVRVLLLLVIGIWGVRLSGYLFYRVLKTGRDRRFDGIRENFWKFASFWTLQAVSIFIILLPALVVSYKSEVDLKALSIFFALMSLVGICIESIADIQKFNFKNNPANKGRWTDVGLWKFSRHPNYLGEMIMWWGVFGFSAFYLAGIEYLSIISPIYISYLLLFVTGVPTVEKRYDEKFGNNPEYLEYKRKSGKILPKFF